MGSIISRFAPSPTGRLHLGHAWSALCAHDVARSENGQFLLRIEDIDTARCRPEFANMIYEDLSWLGLTWNGDVMLQSRRMEVYSEALAKLDAMEVVYRCTCTRSETGESSYPGTCRTLGRSEGAWRLDVSKALALTGPLNWCDRTHGEIVADPLTQGDIIIARKDIGTSYHLAVTVDDAAQGITHVVRGEDLFSATHVHRLLQALLGLPTPEYQHHPLIIGQDGTRLAKHKQSPALAALREQGIDPKLLIQMMREKRFPVGFALASH
jgi:glutamyl-Q tRNA(Asp) synthetase